MISAISQLFYKIKNRFKKPLEIYTDGSVKDNLGSWSYVIVKNNKIVKESVGLQPQTDSVRMELQAAIEALKALPKKSNVKLYSDSRVLVDTATLWKADWKAYGWVKKNKRPIPNVDQIQELDSLTEKHSISWKWVRAHAGIPYNERCDQLCIQARKVSSSLGGSKCRPMR